MWFFLIGWWVFFLPTQHVDGWIPMSTPVLERLKRNRKRAWSGVAAAMALALCCVALRAGIAAGGFVAVAIVTTWFAVNAPGSIRAVLLRDVRWVGLSPVHPAFVAAYEQQLAVERRPGTNGPRSYPGAGAC